MYEILEKKYKSGRSVFIPRIKMFDFLEERYSKGEIDYTQKCVQQTYTFVDPIPPYETSDNTYKNLTQNGFDTYEEALKFIDNIKQKTLDETITETIIHKI